MLGAMHVGVRFAPVSPAYSLMSKDFGKLKYHLRAGEADLVLAADPQKFAPALAAVGASSAPVAEMLNRFRARPRNRNTRELEPETVQDTVHVGLDGHSQGRDRCAPHAVREPADARPGVAARGAACAGGGRLAAVDRTFSANHNFNLVLRNGGTMYVNSGEQPGTDRVHGAQSEGGIVNSNWFFFFFFVV